MTPFDSISRRPRHPASGIGIITCCLSQAVSCALPQMKQLAQEKAAAEASLKDLASQLNTQRGAAAAEAGDVNDLKQFWQVRGPAEVQNPDLGLRGLHRAFF